KKYSPALPSLLSHRHHSTMSHISSNSTDDPDDVVIVGQLGPVAPDYEASVEMDLGSDEEETPDDDTFFQPIELDETIRAAERTAKIADLYARRKAFVAAVDNTFIEARQELESGAARIGSAQPTDAISPTPAIPQTPAPAPNVAPFTPAAPIAHNAFLTPKVLFGGMSYKDCIRILSYITYVSHSRDYDPFHYEAAVSIANSSITASEKGGRVGDFWRAALAMVMRVAESNSPDDRFDTMPNTTHIPIIDECLYRRSIRTFALYKHTLFCKSGKARAHFPKGSLKADRDHLTNDVDVLSEADDTNTAASIRFAAVNEECRELNSRAKHVVVLEWEALRRQQDEIDANEAFIASQGAEDQQDGAASPQYEPTSPVLSPSSPRFAPSSPGDSDFEDLPMLEEFPEVEVLESVAGETLAEFLFTPAPRPKAATLNDRLAEATKNAAIGVPFDPKKFGPSLAKKVPIVAKATAAPRQSNHLADMASRVPARKRALTPDIEVEEPAIVQGETYEYQGHLAKLDSLLATRHTAPPELKGVARDVALRSQVYRGVEKTKLNELLDSRIASMPRDVKRKIVLNEYVNLEQINGFVAGVVYTAPLLSDVLSELVVEKPSSSLAFADSHSWCRAFKEYSRFRVQFYEFEEAALASHLEFMDAKFAKVPALFRSFIAAEAAVRKTVGTPGNPGSIEDIPGAVGSEMSEMSLLASSAPVAGKSPNKGASGSGNAAPRPPSGELCKNWQKGFQYNHGGCPHIDNRKRDRGEEEVTGLEVEVEDPPRKFARTENDVDDSYRISGTTSIPKLRRSLHFPITKLPPTPSVDSTLTSAPLPSPPESVIKDPVLNYVLASRPDLFSITTPLRVNRLENLLSSHPNRPLIVSVILGLREGFWPGHNGDFAESDQLSGPSNNVSDEDHDFLADAAASEFEKGYLSPSFKTLLPGMAISPTHVTTPANGIGRKRGVCDLTGSGLNAGVTKEVSRVQYDAQQVLGTLARYRARRGELNRPGIASWWWKSDVSGGFRNLPVSKYWQIKQIHRIRLRATRKSHGRPTWVYFVDQRLILGGRMSPKIFCTVMSLVLWATKVELGLEFPMAFVDDAFGLCCSGVLVAITHPSTNETRLVPSEQAKLLMMWNYVNFPWDWKKQPSSTDELLIIGNIFRKTATEITVSLAPEAIAAFAEQVEAFLHSKDGKAKLVEWQRITGYANWAVGVLPFARFALQELYNKTSGKTKRNALIAINNTVRHDLRWFVNELQTAPPLDLLDPALEHWTKGDADICIWTDACLVSDDGRSGLGYWAQMGEYKWHSYHRCPEAMHDIVLAEALAVFSAIVWAASLPGVKRILLYTDSSGSVYAYDSGKSQGQLHSLVWATYLELQRLGVDLRVRHIPGIINVTADTLSRAKPHLLTHYENLSLFNPPTHLCRAAPNTPAPTGLSPYEKHARFHENPVIDFPSSPSAPPVSLSTLTAFSNSLIANSNAKSTKRGYEVHYRHWCTFCIIYQRPKVPTAENLALFVAYLSTKRIKFPENVLSGLADYYRPTMPHWKSLRDSELVIRSLKGAAKLPHAALIHALPIEISHLVSLVEAALLPSATYNDLLAAAIAILAFGGVMRLGDCLMLPDKKEDRDPRKIIQRTSVVLEARKSFAFHLPYTKTDTTFRGSTVTIASEFSPPEFNFIDVLELYITKRDRLFGSTGPLLLRKSGVAPTRAWFIPLLKRHAPGVTGHGLRAGGATFLAQLGVPDSLIKRMGRWNSDAWEKYIRDHPAFQAVVAINIAAALKRRRR
ncbi:hypothetical protein P7C70_g8227, partial [Phenoliferia sp. Uapishka_3]